MQAEIRAEDALAHARARLFAGRTGLSDAEWELAERCLGWLEARARPGLLGAALGYVAQASAVRAAFGMVPEALRTPAHRSLTRALVTLSRLAARTAGAERLQGRIEHEHARAAQAAADPAAGAPASITDVAERERLARKLVRSDLVLGAAAGGAGGFAGALALPIEVPLVVGLGLRAAHRTLAALGLDSTCAPGDVLPLLALDLAIGGDAAAAVGRSVGWLASQWQLVAVEAEAGFVAGGEAASSVAGGEAASSVAGGEAAGSVAGAEAASSVAGGEAAGSVAGAEAAVLTAGLVAATAGSLAAAASASASEATTAALSLDAVSYFHVQVAVERIALRLATRRLAAAVPFVGAAVGSALSYAFVDSVIDATRALGALLLLGRKSA